MKPTIVLVHGAFAESSSWDDVVDPLLDAGHPVICAANPLRASCANSTLTCTVGLGDQVAERLRARMASRLPSRPEDPVRVT